MVKFAFQSRSSSSAPAPAPAPASGPKIPAAGKMTRTDKQKQEHKQFCSSQIANSNCNPSSPSLLPTSAPSLRYHPALNPHSPSRPCGNEQEQARFADFDSHRDMLKRDKNAGFEDVIRRTKAAINEVNERERVERERKRVGGRGGEYEKMGKIGATVVRYPADTDAVSGSRREAFGDGWGVRYDDDEDDDGEKYLDGEHDDGMPLLSRTRR